MDRMETVITVSTHSSNPNNFSNIIRLASHVKNTVNKQRLLK